MLRSARSPPAWSHHADGLALDQVGIGQVLQHPGKDRLERLKIDQTPRAGDRRAIRRRLGQDPPEKLAQRKRVRGTPRDGALGIQPFEIADRQQPEIAPRGQPRPALVGVEARAQSFHVPVEVVLLEELI
jgi:hypothetical protein